MSAVNLETSKNGRVKPAKNANFALLQVPGDFHLRGRLRANEEGTVWDFVEAGCRTVLRKSNGIYTWRPEDVYALLRLGKATLYLAIYRANVSGFGIVQQINDPLGNDPPHLLSWIGWSANREARLGYFKALEGEAISHKLREIRHQSTRIGWALDPPTPDWETWTSEGWLKNLTHEQARKLAFSPFFIQRRVL